MHGERYEVVIACDTARGGMLLELWGRHASRELAMEVFFSDADWSFATTRYRDDVPPEVEAWFLEESRRRLPPVADAEPVAAPEGGA